MAISPKLEFRQAQTLVMTPQLQQAIKLLQLSNLELTQYVEQELERNPILEAAEDDNRGDGSEERAAAEKAVDTGNDGDNSDGGDSDLDGLKGDVAAVELDGITLPDGTDVADAGGALDTDYENNYSSAGNEEIAPSAGADDGFALNSWSNGSGQGSGEGFNLEQVLSEGLSLREHLSQQMNMILSDATERLIGADLIENIDDAGYLTEDLAYIADRLGCEDEQVETVLLKLQSSEPTGVFARNLGECLALQLAEKNRLDPAMRAMVENLEMLAAMDLPGLSRICGVDMDDIQDMILELRRLDPKPGLSFDSEVASPVVPDVFVREKADGGWSVELNSETLPRLLVNRHYYTEVSRKTRSKDERTYLSECLQSANWLVKSLDQRARTILKVATELVRQQDAFLAHGVQHLKPLNLRIIAEEVSIHESTVSRVTSNKYMATPRGVFELKYFFTSAISSADGGDDHSSEAVRQRIRELIDDETPAKILSDDKLVELLRVSGIDIARRTVAKYREAIGIPSSVQRRRLKKLRA